MKKNATSISGKSPAFRAGEGQFEPGSGGKPTYHRWSKEQVAFLLDNYQRIGDTELAEIMNGLFPHKYPWTKKHIEKKRSYLKLKRTKDEMHLIYVRNAAVDRYNTKQAWDTKGRSPEGTIVLWRRQSEKLQYIKTANGFVPYYRWLWESVHGPVLEGKLIIIRSGANREDVKIEDLQMINMVEHAKLASSKASQALSDNYVAGILTHKQPELRAFLKEKLPEMIELQKTILQQKRENK